MDGLLAILFVMALAAIVVVGSLAIETSCRIHTHTHTDEEA